MEASDRHGGPYLYRWETAATPRAAVQIVHGLAEHAGRYAELAASLNGAGYAVYAHDHRGHGRTATGPAELGIFAECDGWQKCVDDVLKVTRGIAVDHPGLPVFLLGHSMGSFMVQQFMSEHGNLLAGVILSATDGRPTLLAQAGRVIARLERMRHGPKGHSALIQALAFGAYNRRFAPNRTAFDWLSRDQVRVDEYMSDPRCGFRPRIQLWIDLLDALGEVATPARLARIPRGLPIYLMAGSRDPVSADTFGLRKLIAIYHGAGLERVAHRFYADARHELFHETNREEVIRDLMAWLEGVLVLPRKV